MKYIKILTSEELIVFIKDKFSNWKDLAQELLEKKLKAKMYTPSLSTPNTFYFHSEHAELLELDNHNCEANKMARNLN